MACYGEDVSLSDGIFDKILSHNLLLLKDLHCVELLSVVPHSDQVDLPEATLAD